jgi:hypothetical protein
VPDPLLKREGNMRYAGLASAGYPLDPFALAEELRQHLAGREVTPYGPVTMLFSVAPEDSPPSHWSCQVGVAITGLPIPIPGVQIEDYRALYALSIAHAGPIRDLPATVRRLCEHGKGLGYRIRPYWRLALRRRPLADGNILPVADVAVFLDQ